MVKTMSVGIIVMPYPTLIGFILSQSNDPISGGAGWVGAGLLGSVLVWIFFFHLPAKDKQLKDLIDSCDKHTKEITETLTGELKESRLEVREARQKFDSALRYVVEDSGKQITKLATALRQDLDNRLGKP